MILIPRLTTHSTGARDSMAVMIHPSIRLNAFRPRPVNSGVRRTSLWRLIMGLYGYTEAQWNAAKEEMREVLIDVARRKGKISYTELTGKVHTIHFSPEAAALAHMLDDISREEDAAGRGMLSVIVVHKDGDMMPGSGFFKLAKKLGRDISDKEKCWIEEFNRVYDNTK